eukprot:gene13012-biopygen4548
MDASEGHTSRTLTIVSHPNIPPVSPGNTAVLLATVVAVSAAVAVVAAVVMVAAAIKVRGSNPNHGVRLAAEEPLRATAHL